MASIRTETGSTRASWNCCIPLLAVAALVTLTPTTLMAAPPCSCPYEKSQMHGGTGGTAFSDDLTQVKQITKVTIRHANYIDAIQVTWRLASGEEYQGIHHGGTGGNEVSFTLEEGEYITRIEGRSALYVDQLKFFTNKGKAYGPFGGSGGQPFTAIEGCVSGFFGRSAKFLDAVGAFVSAK